MKKIFIVVALMLGAAAGAGAQGMYDALNFSENNYYGTARSMALGNAVTALGGDLGSVTINPAGSAVAGYSQFVISPGVSIATTCSQYTPEAGTSFTTSGKDNFTRMALPNVGATIHFDLYRQRGLKSISFGIISNTSNNFLVRTSSGGTNEQNTLSAALAMGASNLGAMPSELAEYDNFYNKGASWWPYLVAKQSNIIDYDYNFIDYLGAAENLYSDIITGQYYAGLGGPIDQRYSRQERGYKNDIAINVGFNISDIVYLGVNLGIPVIQYEAVDYFQENAVDPGDFQTNLSSLSMRYYYRATASGVNARFGVIVLPVAGLRLGASYQTPTAYRVADTYYYAGSTSFYSGWAESASQTSPSDDFSYKFRSPSILNLGAAYTLGRIGLISVDWERTFYRQMKFSERDSHYGSDYFYYSNQDIKDYCLPADMIRAGIEVNVIPEVALRAGYTYKNAPESDIAGGQRLKYNTQSASFGVGYSSPGSFFMDLAARGTFYPTKYYYPYSDFRKMDGSFIDYPDIEVSSSRKVWDVVLTLGWRF